MNESFSIGNRSFVRSHVNRSLLRPRQNQTPDPSALRNRSLNKYIQNNNISVILQDVKTGLDASRDLDVTLDERKEISGNLTSLKKKLDETKDYKTRREKEMDWMKAEIAKLKATVKFMEETEAKEANRLEQLTNTVDMQKIKIDEVMQTKNSYLHMIERLKKDKVNDKLKLNNLEEIIKGESYEKSQEEQYARKAIQFKYQANMAYNEVLKQFELEKKKRQDKLNIFQQTLNSKEQVERKREERIKRTQDIAENAANEIRDTNAKKWRELLMVHRFLTSFLKKKMDREMKKYKYVERAFQKIKASTGIADAKEIVTKFVRREETYSDLLTSISTYEKKLEELRKANDLVKSKVQELKEQNISFEKQKAEKDSEGSKLNEIYKELHIKGEEYRIVKLKIERVRDWSTKTLVKLDEVSGEEAQKLKRNDYLQIYPKEKVVEGFLEVVKRVVNYVDITSEHENKVNQVLNQIDMVKVEDVLLDRDIMARNLRVKPSFKQTRAERLKSIESSRSRSNSRGNISRDDSEVLESASREEVHMEPDDEEVTINEQRLELKARAREEMLRRKKLEKEAEAEEKAKAR